MAKVDPVYFESSYYLAPEKGGEKPYRLLADALEKTQRAALAELVSRGKEQVVLIRPYDGGLMLHGLYYHHEVRDFGQVPRAESQRPKQEELKLGAGLIDQMSSNEFDPGKYRDDYRLRAQAMINEKVKGHEITAPAQPARKPRPVIDLLEALKRGISKAPAKAKAVSARRARKKASAG